MSMPTIPVVNIDRDDAINALLISIAMEELSLAHIMNSEGEKIQFAVGTLSEGAVPLAKTIDDLLSINCSVINMLKNVIQKEMLLQFKLENVMDLIAEISDDDDDDDDEE